VSAPSHVSINRFEAMHEREAAHSRQAEVHSQTVPLTQTR
jgi:hypothetical protein